MAYLKSKYRIEAFDKQGNLLADFGGKAAGRKITITRNRTYQCEYNINLDTLEKYGSKLYVNPHSILLAGVNDIKIKRGNVYLFGGQITNVDTNLDVNSRTVSVRAANWLEYFADRVTDTELLYSAIDAGQIFWDLIDEAQQELYGDIGITQGTIQPSVPRDRTYEPRSNIKDLLIKLTEVDDGFDFEITPEKVVNIFYPQMGAVRNEFEFKYPGNVKKLKVSEDATDIVNQAIAQGQGFGPATEALEQIENDPVSRQEFYLRQKKLSLSDVSRTDTLLEHAKEEVSIKHLPLVTFDLTVNGNRKPYIGSYWIGDTITLRISKKIKMLAHLDNIRLRIDEIQINVDENDNEDIKLKVAYYG